MLARAPHRVFITRVGVAHDTGRWIIPQHACQTRIGFRRAITHNDNAGVLRIAHANTTAVMQRHPGRTTSRVQQRVEQRPVGHGIRAITHRLRFAIR